MNYSDVKQIFIAMKETISFLKECAFPADATHRGYEDGIADATHEGKPIPKDTRTAIGLKYAFALGNREHFWKSYHEGYNLGYIDGLRKRHDKLSSSVISHSTNKENFTAMEQSASLEHQRQLVEDLTVRLQRLIMRLNQAQRSYSNQVDELEAAGLVSNVVNRFRVDYHEEVKQLVTVICAQIEANDIRYLNTIKGKIEDAISEFSN